MTDTSTTPQPTGTGEREDLAALLERHGGFLLHTARGLSEEQARLTPTVSALSVGGLIKHVTATSKGWLDFIETGALGETGDLGDDSIETAHENFRNGFRLLPGETLADALTAYDTVSERAVALARTVDLDAGHPLPEAPWFAKEAWSNRRVLIHIIAETAQHAGHADIIRETIDGQRTMG